MSAITLTVVSENRRNVTSRSQGFVIDKIINYVENTNTDFNGNTLVQYQESNENYAIKTFGVNETVAYITTVISGDSVVATAELTVDAADIATLNATPIEIVSAPGVDLQVQIISAVCEYNYDTGAITGNTTLDLVNSTTTANRLMTAATALSGSADKRTRFVDVAGAVTANEGVSVMVNTGAPTMGTSAGSATIKVAYIIL